MLPNILQSRRRLKEGRMFFTFAYSVAILYALLIAAPLYGVITSSFKSTTEIYANILSFPTTLNLTAYFRAERAVQLFKAMGNTFFIIIGTEIIIVGVSVPAAYAVARFRTKIAPLTETFFSAGLLIPAFALLLPVYLTIAKLGLMYTRTSLMLFYSATGLPLSIIILASHMRGIPQAIEDSAIMDGATKLQVIRHIFLPLTQSGVSLVLILNFISVWNEYMFAFIILKTKTRTVQVAAAALLDGNTPDYGKVSAGVILSAIPVILIYSFFQSKIIANMADGAIKG